MIDDIAYEKNSDNQLKGSKEYLQALSGSSYVGIYMLQEMKLIYVNSKLCQMLGYTEEELLNNKDPFELIHPDDIDILIDLRERWLKTNIESFDLDLRIVSRQRKVKSVQIYGSRIDINNKPAVMGVVMDDTENKSAMDNFRMSLESYKTLFDSIGDAIYIQDKDGSFLEVNDGASKLYGYDKSFFIGKYTEILAAPGKVKPDDMKDYIELALNDKPQRFDWWGRKKNGEIFPQNIQLNPGSYFGEKVVIGIARDISEQYYGQERGRESEELFKQLFRNAPIGIVMMDEHREVTMINKGFEKIFGFTQNEIIGLNIDKLIVPEGREEETAELTKKSETFEYSTQRSTKEGRLIDVLIYGVPVIVNGKTIAIYGIYVDITERRRAEDQVLQSLKEKEILLSEIHHRVKNNLAVVTGLLELQGYNTENEDAKKVLKDSQLRINSMALIHEKLYQTGNLSQIKFDIYIEELLQFISRSLISKENPVNIEIDAEPVPLMITQAIPCGLLLNEIVTNSLKHAFPDKRDGTIRITFKKLDDDSLKLIIADNGVGLSDNYQQFKSKTLGMTLINTLAKQLEAEMHIDTSNGTKYELVFKHKKIELDDEDG